MRTQRLLYFRTWNRTTPPRSFSGASGGASCGPRNGRNSRFSEHVIGCTLVQSTEESHHFTNSQDSKPAARKISRELRTSPTSPRPPPKSRKCRPIAPLVSSQTHRIVIDNPALFLATVVIALASNTLKH